jgi:hypothetical protein
MVNTPPQQQRQHQQQQQQQQPAQRQKRKKVAFKAQAISLTDPSAELAVLAVKAITLADPFATTVLDELCQEQWVSDESAYSSANSEDFEVVPFDERVVSLRQPRQPQLSSKVTAWHLGSEELDLDTWTLARNKKRSVKERIEEPNTYASKLKGSAPGPSAKPLEPLRFNKRNNNTVRR